ncbi:MAG: hypothetical protein WD182_06680 [Bacteroidota bacterium]
MTTGTLIWLCIFGLAALLFFGTALVIMVVGAGDLKDLLRFTDKKEK